MEKPPFKIFFICTGNSARSQVAEGLANHLGQGRIEAHSAGTMPIGVNSHAVAVMRERGIDIKGHYSKRIDDVPPPFDLVITLCDHAARLCPVSVREYPMQHWSTPDPTFVPGGPEAIHQAFRQLRDRLEGQIQKLIDQVRPVRAPGGRERRKKPRPAAAAGGASSGVSPEPGSESRATPPKRRSARR
jgi:arsenate reductase